jgi:hypothetical protein
MGKIKVNIGCREYGYSVLPSNTKKQLLDYINNVAPKYGDNEFIKDNVKIAKELLDGKILDRRKIAMQYVIGFIAIASMLEPSIAEASSGIDISPLNKFFKEVYWTMFKITLYISTPVYAWCGYVLLLGGASTDKRKLAKNIALWATLGLGVTAGAPWASESIYNLWVKSFA